MPGTVTAIAAARREPLRWTDFCSLKAQACDLQASAYELHAVAAGADPDGGRHRETDAAHYRALAATCRRTAAGWREAAERSQP